MAYYPWSLARRLPESATDPPGAYSPYDRRPFRQGGKLLATVAKKPPPTVVLFRYNERITLGKREMTRLGSAQPESSGSTRTNRTALP